MAVIDVFRVAAQVGPQASRVNNFTYNNAGEQALAKENANTVNALVQGGEKLYDTMVTADVMKANYEINQKVQDLQYKLYQNKEENARKNMELFKEGRQKIMDEYMKNASWTLGDPRAQAALTRSLDKDWLSQSNQMQRYVLGEQEKFADTQYNNQLTKSLQLYGNSYADEGALKSTLDDVALNTKARYLNYGQEKIDQMTMKAQSAVIGYGIQTAINNDDYITSGKLLQGYGDKLEPSARTSYAKIINARQRSNEQLMTYDGLYKKYGKDINGAIAEMEAQGIAVNGKQGMTFADSEIGKNYGNNTCAIWVSKVMDAAGADPALKSVNVEEMYRLSQERGLTFSDKGQLRDGDVVYWRTHGEDGIDHVGVYDSKTQKVVQSGTSGVKAIDLDTYDVVGFSHMEGRSQDAVAKKKRIDEYKQFYSSKLAQEKAQNNYRVEGVADQMLSLHNNGVTDPKAYEQIINQAAGGSYEIYKSLAPIAKAFGPDAKGNKYKLSVAEQSELEDYINSGGVDQGELIKQLVAKGCSTDTIMHFVRLNKEALAGKGAAHIKWNDVMDVFVERMGGSKEVTKEQRNGIKIYAQRFVNNTFRETGNYPSTDEIVDVMVDGMVKGAGGVKTPGKHFWNSDIQYSMDQLANRNIYQIRDAGKNVDVFFFGNSKSVKMSKEDFAKMME